MGRREQGKTKKEIEQPTERMEKREILARARETKVQHKKMRKKIESKYQKSKDLESKKRAREA